MKRVSVKRGLIVQEGTTRFRTRVGFSKDKELFGPEFIVSYSKL